MRHRVAFRKLGRDSEHRRALLRNLTAALVKHERIRTTLAKAKELRRPAERLITWAKRGTPAAHNQMEAWLPERELMPKVYNELLPRFEERPGGYTRVLKAGFRQGDKAPMAYIEYVDNSLPPLRPFFERTGGKKSILETAQQQFQQKQQKPQSS
ncbi:ribosomal protein L17 [Salpingoeca rosetta]|uniref:Large ribosomal subunit protein bL17c n=1 Tax=Salpingoeca rosetta (strain ATCC 50818 / BSB-021) TaxID=946362 RepID=F2ULC5_SALR5|nr:ribosomal protein L17 [Salpingoeca rosetta]EGD77924.1 ribosomal protein L17 [Salpingoeca rosetta]|eukprot:XP_004989988.1 ribosomal protein L17 [Salpingoeca rosetta]